MKLFLWSSKERRMPLARQFVAIDGESWETFLPPESHGKSLSSPTVACSEASPLESFFSCNGDPQQVIEENTQEQSDVVHENCGIYDTTASALKSALLLNDADLDCGVYDSAANAMRSALQLGQEEKQVPKDDHTVDLDLPSRLNTSDTVRMDNTSRPGAMCLTEGGLKRHEQKSKNQPMYATSDTHEGYNEWKRQQEMRKWWKQTKRQAMERDSREVAPTDEGSKEANHQSSTTMELVTAYPTRPRWSWFWSKKTTEQSHTTTGHPDGDGDTVDTAQVNNTCPKRQTTRSDRWIGKAQQVDHEQKRIQKLREKELQRQRKREADAKKNRPYPIKPHHSESIGMSNKNTTTTKLSSTAISTIPCSICSKGERTHIATPCMHFSFCETCANKLKGRPCPVCGTDKSTYRQVFA